MAASEHESSPPNARERPPADTLAPDSDSSLQGNLRSTVTALTDVLAQDRLTVQEAAAISQQGTVAPQQPGAISDAGTQHQSVEDQPETLDGPPPRSGGLFGFPVSSGRRRTTIPRAGNEVRPRPHPARV